MIIKKNLVKVSATVLAALMVAGSVVGCSKDKEPDDKLNPAEELTPAVAFCKDIEAACGFENYTFEISGKIGVEQAEMDEFFPSYDGAISIEDDDTIDYAEDEDETDEEQYIDTAIEEDEENVDVIDGVKPEDNWSEFSFRISGRAKEDIGMAFKIDIMDNANETDYRTLTDVILTKDGDLYANAIAYFKYLDETGKLAELVPEDKVYFKLTSEELLSFDDGENQEDEQDSNTNSLKAISVLTENYDKFITWLKTALSSEDVNVVTKKDNGFAVEINNENIEKIVRGFGKVLEEKYEPTMKEIVETYRASDAKNDDILAALDELISEENLGKASENIKKLSEFKYESDAVFKLIINSEMSNESSGFKKYSVNSTFNAENRDSFFEINFSKAECAADAVEAIEIPTECLSSEDLGNLMLQWMFSGIDFGGSDDLSDSDSIDIINVEEPELDNADSTEIDNIGDSENADTVDYDAVLDWDAFVDAQED